MPREYKRKTNRGKTPNDVLERAAAEVRNGKSLRGVAKDFNINRMTLKRFILKSEESPQAATGYSAVSIKQAVFTPEMEKDLASHIKLLADMFHGLSLQRCHELAYQFATRNSLDVPNNWERDGKDWWQGFKSRNHLSIRMPEATSFARASAFNRPSVAKFYDNLAAVMDKHHFEPKDIHNVDETGCTTVQKPKDVVTEKGKKQVGSVTSAERGELVTVVYTISASGNVLPPMFVFPRVNYRDHFIKGSPPGSIGRATKAGWMNEDLFLEYLEHVIKQTRCSTPQKILLILDNHDSHISLQAIDLAKSNGIVLLTIPPHTSHRLQPLDRSVYGPFKMTYNRAMDGWLRSNPGKTVTIYEIPGIVTEAHIFAMVPRNILSGFLSCGVCPFNRDIFTDADFAPAETTDRPLDINTTSQDPPEAGVDHVQDANQTSTAAETTIASTERPTNPPTQIPSTSDGYVSPQDVHPLPKAGPRNQSCKRKKGSTKILTDTPVRDEIAGAIKARSTKTNSNDVKSKKSLFQEPCMDSSSSESDGSSDMDLDDESDADLSEETEIIEGDFVVVKVAGKSRTVHYIARVDVVDGEEFKGIFLQKLSGRVGNSGAVFVPNASDESFFPKSDGPQASSALHTWWLCTTLMSTTVWLQPE